MVDYWFQCELLIYLSLIGNKAPSRNARESGAINYKRRKNAPLTTDSCMRRYHGCLMQLVSMESIKLLRNAYA